MLDAGLNGRVARKKPLLNASQIADMYEAEIDVQFKIDTDSFRRILVNSSFARSLRVNFLQHIHLDFGLKHARMEIYPRPWIFV